jgi:hypothetical protein
MDNFQLKPDNGKESQYIWTQIAGMGLLNHSICSVFRGKFGQRKINIALRMCMRDELFGTIPD